VKAHVNGKAPSRTFILLAVSLFIFICAVIAGTIWLYFALTEKPKITKGDAYEAVNRDVRIGATKTEVLQYVNSLKVNGIKAESTRGYVKNESYFTVIAPDNKKVGVEGTIYASFPNEEMSFNFCPHVGVIFYFDKSDTLITYHIDCFG
jgi:hypothetical protein